MDSGSSLNLIYADTLKKIPFDESRIEPTKTKFKGIIPGMEARCTGRVTLDVVFGTPDDYRLEPLSFDIVPFKCGYHALLGRTSFTCIGVVPHYAYHKLKMPSPNGIITISGNVERSLKSEQTTLALAAEAEAEALAAKSLPICGPRSTRTTSSSQSIQSRRHSSPTMTSKNSRSTPKIQPSRPR